MAAAVGTAVLLRGVAAAQKRAFLRKRLAKRSAIARCAEGDGVAPVDAAPTVSDADEKGSDDRLVRYLGGNVSVRALTATELVREACKRHGCSPMASLALGRALMGTALLANGRDVGEILQLRIMGHGPSGAIITEATSALRCRGFIAEPQANAATVPELIGMGTEEEEATIRITRMHPFWKQPYTGTIQLKTGEIAEDIVQYLAVSEQTPASMGLSVEWDHEKQEVKHAEGWLVTLLPGWEDGEVGVVEANISSFGRMDEPAEGVGRPEAICEHMMRELRGEFQMEDRLSWSCNCSTDRLLRAVMMLGKTEVLRILKAKEDLQAKCDWCGRSLSLTAQQVREYMKTDKGEQEVNTRSASPRQLKLKDDEVEEMPEPGTANWG